jgi:hypothetical protein
VSQIDESRCADAPHPRSMRRRLTVVGAAVLVVGAAAVATQLPLGGVAAVGAAPAQPAFPGATSTGSAPASATATPDAVPSTRGASAAGAAFPGDSLVTDAVESALQIEATVLGATTDHVAALESLEGPDTSAPTDPFTESLKVTALEYDAMGWRQTGAPQVEWIELLMRDEDATPPRLQILACLDSSGVDVTDEQGRSLRGAATPARTAQVLTLVDDGTGWRVIDATFPDDPDC